jgi:hypothetical protein
MAKPPLYEVPRRHLPSGNVVGKDARKFRFGPTFEQLDDRLARLPIDARQPLVINLADDSIWIPIAEPFGKVSAGMAVDSAIDVEQPGQAVRALPANQPADIKIALARCRDDATHHTARVGVLCRQDQRHPNNLGRRGNGHA